MTQVRVDDVGSKNNISNLEYKMEEIKNFKKSQIIEPSSNDPTLLCSNLSNKIKELNEKLKNQFVK